MKIFDQYKGLSIEVYLISLSRLVTTMGAFIWPMFVMILKTKIHMTEGEITLYAMISMGVAILSSLAGGVLSDKIGRKRTIVLFELLGMISFASIVFFEVGIISAVFLMIGMMFFGLAGPAHEALLANITKTEERETAYSLNYIAMNLGIIIGPAVGGLLLDNYFSLFIIIDVLTTFLGWLLLILLVKERKQVVIENEYENNTKDSMISIVRKRPIIFFYGLLMFFTSFTYGQLDFTLPLYVVSLFGESGEFFGLLYSFNGLTVVLFTALVTNLLRKKTAINKIIIGFAFYIVALFAYSIVDFKIGLFFLMFLFTIGEIIIAIGGGPILSKIVPQNLMGRIAGTMSVFYMTGHLLAMLIPGLLLDKEFSFKFVWIVVGSLSLIGYGYLFLFKIKYGKIIDKVDSLDSNRK